MLFRISCVRHDTFNVNFFRGSLCCLQRYITCLHYLFTYIVIILCIVNRQGLDITLLAEPSSDEDDVEQTTKRQKRRRKQAATSAAVEGDKERKVDIKPPASVAALSSGGAANQSAATDNKFQAAVRTRKRLQSLCCFLSELCLYISINLPAVLVSLLALPVS